MPSKKLVNITLHVVITALIVSVALFVIPYTENPVNPYFLDPSRIVYSLTQVAITYFTAYVLYPRLLLKKKVFTFIFTGIGIAALSSICYYLLAYDHYSSILARTIVKFFITIFIVAGAICYIMIIDLVKNQQRQKEHLMMELSFLRSQVSPHFMFNTLNSMVWLARTKSDRLETALLELSNLMHYMLYESEQEKVSISNEIDYIQSYIDLQTLRFGSQVAIRFHAPKPQGEKLIEPMLLIPLIENAFKHGVGLMDHPVIDIELEVAGNTVALRVSNKYQENNTEVRDEVSGIGLKNLNKRLNLLYPGTHELVVHKDGEWYITSLKIQLHD